MTAKLKDEFYDLILSGKKKYEIRDESFGDAQIIRYISSISGRQLGIFALGNRSRVDRSEDERLIKLAAVPRSVFYKLFPTVENGGVKELWVVEILSPIDIDDLFKGE